MQRDERDEWFTKMVQQNKHAMYRIAWGMVRSAAQAEDAVSDAVETAWRKLSGIRDPNALPAYLLRCTINACHAILRRRKREFTAPDLPEATAPLTGTPVWMYLSGLDEKYRLPLLMRFGERMAVEEIAHILRLPRGTVSSRIARGLKMLKTQIEMEEQGRG